jgi:nucleoside-diphosphate-sugar epimerase
LPAIACDKIRESNMLLHLNSSPALPSRVVVLGAGGFVGAAVLKSLWRRKAPVLAVTHHDVDLLAPDAGTTLAGMLRPDDALVAIAARAPCKNIRMLGDNVSIIAAIVDALKKSPVAHVFNISSDAVYADSPAPLTEASTLAPDTLHGIMHLAREVTFRSEVTCAYATLRPSLLYGASDPHNGYGPNRFRRLANEGKDIVLFGEGEERRDHVFIEDVAELITRAIEWRSVGSLNIATGEVHSFRAIAEEVKAASGRNIAITGSPRSGPMPHDGFRPFDISGCCAAFPDFRYTPLAVGIAKAQAEEFGTPNG